MCAASAAPHTRHPRAHLRLARSQWPWRPAALFALTFAAAAGAAFVPADARRPRP
jgi:hypothetical protein